MNFLSKEIKIALAGIAAIVTLFFGINFLKGKAVFSNDNEYFVRFNDISGLSASNPILANGYQVGIVKSINYDYRQPGNIVVCFGVDRGLRIPEGSTAEIESDFMGNVKMNLILSASPTAIAPGDTLNGNLRQGALAKAADLIPTVQQILPKIDSIMANLNTLMADPSIANTLHNAEHITNDLTTSTRELNQLLATANKNMPTLMTKADGVLSNADQATANLAQIDFQETIQKVDQTIANLKSVTEKLNSKNNSLGLLMNDQTLYNNLNQTLHSADTLLTNIREHPKRYINISVFGRKEK